MLWIQDRDLAVDDLIKLEIKEKDPCCQPAYKEVIKYLNRTYYTKIKEIIFLDRNFEKMGYNIFYKE